MKNSLTPADACDTTPDEIHAVLGSRAPRRLQNLLAQARRMHYEAQETLYHQGGENNTVFFVASGLLKLITHLPNGRARIVRLHRPGSVLGLSGVLNQSNEHTAMAVTPVTALRLPLTSILRLRSEDPAIYIHLVERWHQYLQDADTWITQFSTGPIRGRVARLLAFLADFEPGSASGQVQLMTCEEMASILGVTTESVSRILAEFKRLRILDNRGTEQTETYLTDAEQLQGIALE